MNNSTKVLILVWALLLLGIFLTGAFLISLWFLVGLPLPIAFFILTLRTPKSKESQIRSEKVKAARVASKKEKQELRCRKEAEKKRLAEDKAEKQKAKKAEKEQAKEQKKLALEKANQERALQKQIKIEQIKAKKQEKGKQKLESILENEKVQPQPDNLHILNAWLLLVIVGIALFVIGITINLPPKELTSYLFEDDKYYVEAYINGDAYNYIIAASQWAGEYEAMSTKKTIYICFGVALFSIGIVKFAIQWGKDNPDKEETSNENH